jgi:DNA excision repair protein ERCC-6
VKAWNNKPNIIFADKLKRRFKMVIADEAHAFSKKLSKRTLALRRLKAKYWLFLTGTPINNTVKNLWSICDILFKAGTPRFPYTTSDFRKQFVTVEMVTRQFDETLCKGKTSQQLPKIKDLVKFLDLVKYMWIRRLKEEPKVCENVQIVKPTIEVKEFIADEEHWRVYKEHLDHFAELFIKYLHPELHEHDRVKAAVVLAQLGNLQFVSTIPQHAKFDIFESEFQYKKSLTVIQSEVLTMVQQNYKTEKILVISQRPDFCVLMQKKLKERNIASGVFTGQVEIAKRNQILDKFESAENFNVLLCSINVIKEGINIPTGSMVIIVDLDWTYQKLEQAYSRVLRPETKRSPKVFMLYYKGFIDQYLWQHIRAKKSAVLEGVDHRTDVEEVKWVHWKEFTINMLQDLGYSLR